MTRRELTTYNAELAQKWLHDGYVVWTVHPDEAELKDNIKDAASLAEAEGHLFVIELKE